MAETVFHKIARGDVQAEVLYREPFCFVIRDANPQAPVHLLVIPDPDYLDSDGDPVGGEGDYQGYLRHRRGRSSASGWCPTSRGAWM